MNIKTELHFLIKAIPILSAIAVIAGCAVTGTTLNRAALQGQTNVVREILDKGGDVNERGGCAWGWSTSVTTLSCAAYGGHIETVKVLIERGADVNARDEGGWTPLVSAAYMNHTAVSKLLMENGADVNAAMDLLTTWSPGRSGLVFLQRLVNERQPPRKSEALANEPSHKPYPAIKSDIDELPATKTRLNKNAYAIVVGIENYRQKLPRVDYAVSDARLVSQYLTQVMGYPEENVVLLTNEKALQSDLAKYFERWLHNQVEKDGSTVFIYYSGHGAPDHKTGGAYLVPYDGDPSFISETGYSLKRMYDTLGKLPAREIIVVLDSCFSGAGGRSVIAKGMRPLVINHTSSMIIPPKMTVLTASAGDQVSATYDEKGHGLFTYFFLKGIRNEEVVKKDGSIALGDLFSYIKPQVELIARKQYNNEQTPQLIGAKKD